MRPCFEVDCFARWLIPGSGLILLESAKIRTIAELDGTSAVEAREARYVATAFGMSSVRRYDEDGNEIAVDFSAETNAAMRESNARLSSEKAAIKSATTPAENEANRLGSRSYNNDYVDYYFAELDSLLSYYTAIAEAEENYYNTVIVSAESCSETLIAATSTFDALHCQLSGRFEDALRAIDADEEIDAAFFENGQSSIYVQVCFTAGTPVVMEDGTVKPIEKVKAGDRVKSVCHETPDGVIVSGNVVRTFRNAPQPVWHLKFQGENGL